MEKKVLFVAVCVSSREQAFRETAKVFSRQAAHGVFLVNYKKIVSATELFNIALDIKALYREYFIGVNVFDQYPAEALNDLNYLFDKIEKNKHFDILWTNTSGIKKPEDDRLYIERPVVTGITETGIICYATITTKDVAGQPELLKIAQVACRTFTAVILTGVAKGEAPHVNLVASVKDAIGKESVGVVGLSIYNLADYFPYTNIFIVNTSLLVNEDDYFNLDGSKIEEFKNRFDELRLQLLSKNK